MTRLKVTYFFEVKGLYFSIGVITSARLKETIRFWLIVFIRQQFPVEQRSFCLVQKFAQVIEWCWISKNYDGQWKLLWLCWRFSPNVTGSSEPWAKWEPSLTKRASVSDYSPRKQCWLVLWVWRKVFFRLSLCTSSRVELDHFPFRSPWHLKWFTISNGLYKNVQYSSDNNNLREQTHVVSNAARWKLRYSHTSSNRCPGPFHSENVSGIV